MHHRYRAPRLERLGNLRSVVGMATSGGVSPVQQQNPGGAGAGPTTLGGLPSTGAAGAPVGPEAAAAAAVMGAGLLARRRAARRED